MQSQSQASGVLADGTANWKMRRQKQWLTRMRHFALEHIIIGKLAKRAKIIRSCVEVALGFHESIFFSAKFPVANMRTDIFCPQLFFPKPTNKRILRFPLNSLGVIFREGRWTLSRQVNRTWQLRFLYSMAFLSCFADEHDKGTECAPNLRYHLPQSVKTSSRYFWHANAT
jgi:hypothetical protein